MKTFLVRLILANKYIGQGWPVPECSKNLQPDPTRRSHRNRIIWNFSEQPGYRHSSNAVTIGSETNEKEKGVFKKR